MTSKLLFAAILLVFTTGFVSAVSLRAKAAATYDADDAMRVMNFFGATSGVDLGTEKRSTPFLIQRDDRDRFRGRGKNAETTLIQGDDRGLFRGRGKNVETTLIQGDDRGLFRGRGKNVEATLIQGDDRGLFRGRGKNVQM